MINEKEMEAIQRRLEINRHVNAIDDGCEPDTISMFYSHDVSILIAEVKRLTRERDAMAEDFTVVMRGLTRLEQGSDYVRLEKEPCKTCAYGPTSKGCYACGRIDYGGWQWRGVKEVGE